LTGLLKEIREAEEAKRKALLQPLDKRLPTEYLLGNSGLAVYKGQVVLIKDYKPKSNFNEQDRIEIYGESGDQIRIQFLPGKAEPLLINYRCLEKFDANKLDMKEIEEGCFVLVPNYNTIAEVVEIELAENSGDYDYVTMRDLRNPNKTIYGELSDLKYFCSAQCPSVSQTNRRLAGTTEAQPSFDFICFVPFLLVLVAVAYFLARQAIAVSQGRVQKDAPKDLAEPLSPMAL